MSSNESRMTAADSRMTPIMDGPGNLIRFSPFGTPSDPFSKALAIAGQPWERQSRLYSLGKRHYSPALMHFLQPDDWSPFGAGGMNAYAYAIGDPINYSDPTGHLPFSGLIKAIKKNVFLMDDVLTSGKKALIIDAHGNAGIGRIGADIFDGAQFAKAISQHVQLADYDHVNLVMCLSANTPQTGGMPFAQAFAEQANIKTIGYRGTVTANYSTKELADKFKARKPIDRYKIDQKNPFKKGHPELNTFSYEPVEFLPSDRAVSGQRKKRR